MIARNCTRENLVEALAIINKPIVINTGYYGNRIDSYDGNVVFKRCDAKGKGFIFTLTVKDSKRPGARRSDSGRRIAAACWHVHGRFFEALFSVAPDAKIFSSFYKRQATGQDHGWITKEHGNWEDGQIGSACNPIMMSEACDC